MTLQEWANVYDRRPTLYKTDRGAAFIKINPKDTGYRALYSLDDYTVSSVCGTTVWLAPRNQNQG
jgi:hypothetical protein